jgi:hypothetical protein
MPLNRTKKSQNALKNLFLFSVVMGKNLVIRYGLAAVTAALFFGARLCRWFGDRPGLFRGTRYAHAHQQKPKPLADRIENAHERTFSLVASICQSLLQSISFARSRNSNTRLLIVNAVWGRL